MNIIKKHRSLSLCWESLSPPMHLEVMHPRMIEAEGIKVRLRRPIPPAKGNPKEIRPNL